MKLGQLVLLVSKESSYLVEVRKGKLNTQDGIFDLSKLLKKNYGGWVRTHLGKKFEIVKPNLVDILEKKAKRLPQIIMSKDVGLILTFTGIGKGSLVVDAGTGSGFLAIWLAYHVNPGKVISYEKNKRFLRIAKENVKLVGLKNVKIKEKDITRGIDERKVDLITLDLKDAEKAIKHAFKALKVGGWLVVYSPYIEQVISVCKEIKKMGFSEPRVVENIVREWKVEKYTRPYTIGILHSGFLTFTRKVER